MEHIIQDSLGFLVIPLRRPDMDILLMCERYPHWVKDEIRRLYKVYNSKDDKLEFALMLACDEWRLPWRPAWRTNPEDNWHLITKDCYKPLSYTEVYGE